MLRSSGIASLALAGLLWLAPAVQAQETGVAGELERTAGATPKEKLDYSAGAVEEMREAVKSTSRLLEAARRDGAVEEIQCLSNRMTPLRALLQVSEQAETSLKDRLGVQDTAGADREFRKIAVALTKSRQLVAEAERCVDATALQSGDTVTSWEGAATTGDDTIDPGFTAFDLGFDPPESSPFM